MTTTMTHRRLIAAPPDVVYRLVEDVSVWPVVFGPSVYVRHLERRPAEERFRIWALVAGEVRDWVSLRELDPDARRISFRQQRTHAPVTSMGGTWTCHPVDGGHTEVVLDHDFTVAGSDDELAAITSAVDHNSNEELEALARIAELGYPIDEVIDTFVDTVELDGSVSDGYDFVYRSDLWPSRLPHVDRAELTEDVPGVQHMEMDTVTAGGDAHTTRSIRLCFSDELIVYKQLLPPRMLFGHNGEWEFRQGSSGAEVSARHTVAINPVAAREVLGEHTTLAEARQYLREALGNNGKATLAHAGDYVRARKDVSLD